MIKKASQIIIAVLLILVMGDAIASNLNIDYSHNVAGTGTVMTNFEMGSAENTKAIGEVHGTGEILISTYSPPTALRTSPFWINSCSQKHNHPMLPPLKAIP